MVQQHEAAERHGQASKLVDLLKRRRFDHQLGMERVYVAWDREPEVANKLFQLCGQEIFEALAADTTGQVFCSLWIVPVAVDKVRFSGNIGIIQAGISKAIRAALKQKDCNAAALVKKEVASELARYQDERIAAFRQLRAQEILPRLLAGVRNELHEYMAVHMNHLTGAQRSDLTALLHDQLSDEPVIFLRMDETGEPKKPELWLFWYLWRLSLVEIKEQLGGIPRFYPALRRGALPFGKDGYPRDPLGPIHAKVYQKLGRMLPSHPKRDPKSKSTTAASLRVQKDAKGVNRSVLERYLKADVPVTMTPNGEDAIDYTFTAADMLASIKTVCGEKRGPKPKNA